MREETDWVRGIMAERKESEGEWVRVSSFFLSSSMIAPFPYSFGVNLRDAWSARYIQR